MSYRSKSLMARSLLAAGLVSGLGLAQSALAEDAPAAAPAAAEPGPFTANVTLTNDYRYRGISQSNFNPAIQGGFDYAHESGFYIGNWNSSISWISDAVSTLPNQSTSAPIEMDFYAGYKHDWSKGFISCSITTRIRDCRAGSTTRTPPSCMSRKTSPQPKH